MFPGTLMAEDEKYSLTLGAFARHYRGEHREGFDNELDAFSYKDWTAAYFKNSFGGSTLFGGHWFKTDKIYNGKWWVRGNLYAGVLYGYGDKVPIRVGKFSPGMYPTGSLGYGRHSVELGLMPTFMWWAFKVEF